MLAGRGQLEQALRGAKRSVEGVRTKLTVSEEQRKALALVTAEMQQLLGAARPEAVVPAIQALKKDKERVAAAKAEGKAARGALEREVIKVRIH